VRVSIESHPRLMEPGQAWPAGCMAGCSEQKQCCCCCCCWRACYSPPVCVRVYVVTGSCEPWFSVCSVLYRVAISAVFSSNRASYLGAKYCDEYVCLFVCLHVCLSARITRKPNGRTSPNFCARCMWPWIGPTLTPLQYVMYFRLYG